MEITIGKYDTSTRSVPVTFEHEGVKHERSVNACLTSSGGYDKKATAERVEQVAVGVQHKIALGVITNPPVEDVPQPDTPSQ